MAKLLSWSTVVRPTSKFVAHGFPSSFQLNPIDVRNGSVRVVAKSPSGQTFPMDVVENEGVYNTNFIPTEIGNWQISILFEGEHIQGSPFNVRVYDPGLVKVAGLTGGVCGHSYSFTVDTSGAGDGQLAVSVTHSGRNIPVRVVPDNFGHYKVYFTPDVGGLYMIQIYFAGLEVTGSPFSVNVVESSELTVSGDGVGLVPVNLPTSFILTASRITEGALDLQVTITSPRGTEITPRIKDLGDGTFHVEYTPYEVGRHVIDVQHHSRPIIGSPFAARVYDVSMVIISSLQPSCLLGDSVQFDIDVANAGDGSLQIMVNNGKIPCSVFNLGNRKYRATFTPQEAKQHSIEISFNGFPVAGSPCFVDVQSHSKFSFSEKELAYVPVGKTAKLELKTGSRKGMMTANVTGPSGRNVTCRIVNQHQGICRLEYTPAEIGLHTIGVLQDGKPIPGSPISSRAFSTAAIVVGQVPMGVIGLPVEFTVDVSKAGEGKLEVMVNRGTIPNSICSLGQGTYEIGFIPRVLQPHTVDVTFNGQALPGGPISVPIIDQSKLAITGNGSTQAAVNQKYVFHVNTQSAGDAELSAKVTPLMSGGSTIQPIIRGSSSKGYDVEFVTRQIGNYRVDVEYGGTVVKGSPFTVKSFDISKIKVLDVGDGIVGKESSVIVDVEGAGEGDLEIGIMSGSGHNIRNKVQAEGSKQYRVSYMPVENGLHKANITFNKQHIPGSPFSFYVNDLSKVTAQGDGLESVQCNRIASFTISGPRLQPSDLEILITGPNGHTVIPRVFATATNSVAVEYTPSVPGEHKVAVSFQDHPITGSPFISRAWDPSRVYVSNLRPGRAWQLTKFDIDASQAGPGNLETIVTCESETIPNFVTSEGNGHFTVTFTPLKAETHAVSVKFNGEPVPGSPFHHSVLDGRRAAASGEGLGHVLAGRSTSFDVTTRDVGGDADLQVEVFDSGGEPVPSQISASVTSDYRVVYTPKRVGRYTINVKYADVDIKGSPFLPEVYDPECVTVKDLSDGTLGKPITFTVDAGAAGEGHVTVKVKGQTSQPFVDISARSDGCCVVRLEPREGGPHHAYVYFNDIQIPGSPFEFLVLDPNVVHAKWEAARLCPTNRPVHIELESKGILHGNIAANVSDPYGKPLDSRVYSRGTKNVVEFVPMEVGPHSVEVFYGSEPLRGSPFVSDIYDVSRVKLFDLPDMAIIGEQVAFTIDTGEAGSGDIDVTVTSGSAKVPVKRERLSEFCQRVTFVPSIVSNHTISVAFNGDTVVGSPVVLKVKNPIRLLEVVNPHSHDGVSVGTPASVRIETRGAATVHPSDIVAKITAPGGDLLPVLAKESGGGCRIEFTCKRTGRHTVELFYENDAIVGSPFHVEAFDPGRVKIEGKRSWFIGEKAQIDVNHVSAGKADVGVTINGPRGSSVPFDIYALPHGHQISYTATEKGSYQIYVTYGGVNIPGSPVVHTIAEAIQAVASGQGLMRGIKDKVTAFVVDPRGRRGELVVEVDGPNSIAKCNVEPGSNGTYRVSYVPVEIGVYSVTILWNGRPVEGSPFRPIIVDPSKVDVVGGWPSVLDSNGQLPLTVHENNVLTFKAKHAGPGQLSAEVTCGDTVVPSNVIQTDKDHYQFTFVPHAFGKYVIKVFWSGVQLLRSPIVGVASAPMMDRHHLSSTASASSDKVLLKGQGLHEAKVNQRADFVIDGTDAGNGSPEVSLVGLSCDIPVQCVPLGGQKYQCSYVAMVPGSYLLNILWANRPVRGSPFKVTVMASSSSSKVACMGNGLSFGVVGQELRSVIDTRRAGSGELSATCSGPTVMAVCELIDHRDGTFTLSVKPQEPGRHILEIRYDDDHIPGSPFVIKVSGSPDASRVTAHGPGLQHGILSKFQSHFMVDAAGAGAGQLTVRVRGPKDAFHVEMQRVDRKDRTIICRYDPTEAGDYIVHVKWSGVHIPGSPFHVNIFDTEAELEEFKANNVHRLLYHQMATPSPRQNDAHTYFD